MKTKMSTLMSKLHRQDGFVLMEFVVLLLVSTLLFAGIGQAIGSFAYTTGVMLRLLEESNDRAKEKFERLPLKITAE
jgi:hypothetical protein